MTTVAPIKTSEIWTLELVAQIKGAVTEAYSSVETR